MPIFRVIDLRTEVIEAELHAEAKSPEMAAEKALGLKLVRAGNPRNLVCRVYWQDEKGGNVNRDKPAYATYLPGAIPQALPDYPADKDLGDGWTLLAANAAVAAKLRQWLPRLDSALAAKGRQGSAIRIRVQSL